MVGQWKGSVHEAMNSFFDIILRSPARLNSAVDPQNDESAFAERLHESPFHLWKPGDPIPDRGTRMLLGLATWSGYDMHLLDVISESMMRETPTSVSRVDVFDTAQCNEAADFRKYIPKLRHVTHTPVVGIWRDGHLHEAKEGYAARDLAAGLFGSSSAEIVAFVQNRLKSQSAE
jgi:hypothetical protein